jgi:hypothetical protein
MEVDMRFLMLVGVLAALLAWPVSGDTYVVRPDGTGAFPTIQAAIDAVVDGDIIELTDGVFQGDGNRDIIWADKQITLRSQSGDPYNCILDCEGSLRRNHWGIYLEDVGPGALVQAVTVRNGIGGGGMPILDSSPVIDRCVFFNNEAGEGGGILINGDGSYPVITACTFSANWAIDGGGLCI